MAAAVMRAMTFGATSGGSARGERGRDAERSGSRGGGSSSRSNSRSGLSFSRSSTIESTDAGASGLSRVSSIVTASSPPPASILLNPVTSAPSSIDASRVAASSPPTANIDIASPRSASRPPLARNISDTSSSYSHAGPLTPVSTNFPPPSNPSSPFSAANGLAPSSSLSDKDQQQHKRPSTIRFAPLPEIRPRSYSTGRNVWIVDDDSGGIDVEGEDGVTRRQRLVRVGSDAGIAAVDENGQEFEYALAEDDEDDEAEGIRNALQKWGSWSESFGGGMWGLSPSTSRRGGDDDAISTTSSMSADGGTRDSLLSTSVGSDKSGGSSKLLKAFGLGRGKSRRKKGAGDDDLPLSRTSSGESEVSTSRRSMGDAASPARPKGSTGIPMRKAYSWEVGDQPSGGAAAGDSKTGGPVYYAAPTRAARRRANYPPVAQRSRNRSRGSSSAVQVEEPKFNEWGVGGMGARDSRRVGGGVDEEDDGSGMAWLKKRRMEREKAERERLEQEANKGQQEESGDGAGDADEAARQEEDEQQHRPPSPAPMSAPPDVIEFSQSVPLPSHIESLRRGPPSRSGTLDSTTSTASTIRPTISGTSTPSTTSIPPARSGLSATRPTLVIDVPSQPSSSTASPGGGSVETPITSPVSSGEQDDEEEEEEEEDDDGESDDSDDDDLDEEELEREEALAAEARRTAKQMGAERYHSARHENQLKVVDEPQRPRSPPA
ncbi:hypothetical protein Rhopal_001355-T1 [Rhodotorula paludigena]|uniref:Uncharacterized protein n=1 Tax=Rhodotorula paludigena TaxID=86838 RepID=A0AAV5GD38_9BASI|nr:hypothetical protein Rhopal_001355-T1 [Rhodotorula paludigena]